MEITEDYVSFETAKLLKEKGFDVVTEKCYILDNSNLCAVTVGQLFNGKPQGKYEIAAPTLQMAMKWLREVHHIFIQVELYSKRNDYCFDVFKNTHRILIEYLEVCNSYEEAVVAALNYCLNNLIK